MAKRKAKQTAKEQIITVSMVRSTDGDALVSYKFEPGIPKNVDEAGLLNNFISAANAVCKTLIAANEL